MKKSSFQSDFTFHIDIRKLYEWILDFLAFNFQNIDYIRKYEPEKGNSQKLIDKSFWDFWNSFLLTLYKKILNITAFSNFQTNFIVVAGAKLKFLNCWH